MHQSANIYLYLLHNMSYCMTTPQISTMTSDLGSLLGTGGYMGE